MSYATMFLTILFVINVGLFLYGWDNPLSSCGNCSPMFQVLSSIIDSEHKTFNYMYFFIEGGKILLIAGGIASGIWLLNQGMGFGGSLTGATSQINPLTVLAIAVMIQFTMIPNFSAMLAEPFGTVVTAIFGFLAALAIFGILRGE